MAREMAFLNVVEIASDGWNARRCDLAPDDELLKSIMAQGVLEPIGVQHVQEGYRCIYGFRRLAAARALKMQTIPAIIHDDMVDDLQVMAANLAENYQRRNLRPWEMAQALFEMHQASGLEGKELGPLVGMSPEHAVNLLRVRRKLAPVIWEQFVTWGVTHKVPFQDLVDLCAHPWDEQIERWNRAHDWYQGARRGCEYRPGPAKMKKMLKRLDEHPEAFREGPGFAAGARYALRVALGQEPWRHGGVATLQTRRQRAKNRLKGSDT